MDRRKMLAFLGVSPALVRGAPSYGRTARTALPEAAASMTIIKVKKGNFVTDDPALWKEIADSKGAGVVLDVAG
jgi:hypothetical protein